MVSKIFVTLALVLFLSSEVAFAKNVVDLTADTIDASISSGTWFIEFYAPWCGFCQRLEPIWEEFGTKSKGSSVNVARVNCDENRMVCRRFGVEGFPTLQLIVNQRVYDYPEDDDRAPEAFTAFATTGFKKVLGRELPTNSFIDPFLAVAESTVIDVMNLWDTHTIHIFVLFFLGFFAGFAVSLIVIPQVVGFSPSFIVPRTVYLLRRPGENYVVIQDPTGYDRVKKSDL